MINPSGLSRCMQSQSRLIVTVGMRTLAHDAMMYDAKIRRRRGGCSQVKEHKLAVIVCRHLHASSIASNSESMKKTKNKGKMKLEKVLPGRYHGLCSTSS